MTDNIKKAESSNDIKIIVSLAREIYTEHYESITGLEQVEYMLNKFQNEEAIGEQIKNGVLYYTFYDNSIPCGYFAVEPNEPKGKLFLSKLYIRKSSRGKGLSSKAFHMMKSIAQDNNLSSIWLHVNKENPSIDVYKSQGFEIAESVKDSIGGGFYMDDYLMELKLTD